MSLPDEDWMLVTWQSRSCGVVSGEIARSRFRPIIGARLVMNLTRGVEREGSECAAAIFGRSTFASAF